MLQVGYSTAPRVCGSDAGAASVTIVVHVPSAVSFQGRADNSDAAAGGALVGDVVATGEGSVGGAGSR